MRRIKRAAALLLAVFFVLPVAADYDPEATTALDTLQESDGYWQTVSLTAATGSPEVTARAAVLMDAATGTVLFEKDADTPLPPASVTKIMTLLLLAEAIDRGDLARDETVTVSAEASQMGGSQIYLKENEQMTVDELLKATVVASANDAAYALGEHLAGSMDAFVLQMNERAAALGMKNTVFYNPTGLPCEGHVSSARDIAVMSRELIKHEFIMEYTSIWMDYLRDGQTMLVNTNKLIRHYNGATGLKTGSTDEAGYCLSATAERNGLSLIAVVLGSPSGAERFDDAKALLDYGFLHYALFTPTLPETFDAYPVINGKQTSVSVTAASPTPLLLKKGEEETVKITVSEPVTLTAPVEKGTPVGTVTVSVANEVRLSLPLTVTESVEKLTWWYLFTRAVKNFLTI